LDEPIENEAIENEEGGVEPIPEVPEVGGARDQQREDAFSAGVAVLRACCLDRLGALSTGAAESESWLALEEVPGFAAGLWDAIDSDKNAWLQGASGAKNETGDGKDAPAKAANPSLSPEPKEPRSAAAEASWVCAAAASVAMEEDLLPMVNRLEAKVRAAQGRGGQHAILEFGGDAGAVWARAETAFKARLAKATAGSASRSGVSSAGEDKDEDDAEEGGEAARQERAKLLELRRKLVSAMEPSLRRHLALASAGCLAAFEDAFAHVVGFGDCGAGSDFDARAQEERRGALERFDAAAQAAIPKALARAQVRPQEGPGRVQEFLDRHLPGGAQERVHGFLHHTQGFLGRLPLPGRRHAGDQDGGDQGQAAGPSFGWSAERERLELAAAIDDIIELRRAEAQIAFFGMAFDGSSADWASDGGAQNLRGIRGVWHKLPPWGKVAVARSLPLIVNYVQGWHTLLAKRRAAVRQDTQLPVIPLF